MRHRRPPDDIMLDFDDGAFGVRDIDMHTVLWEIIDDILDSYDLAMRNAKLDQAQYLEISDTVKDYITNHYS